MNASALELTGMLIACGAAATALLARDRRLRHGAIAVALVAAPTLVAGDVWDQQRFEDLRDSPAQLAVIVAAVLGLVAVGAAAFTRYPATFPIAAFAVLPLRVPVELGGETSNLLIPLYGVIAAGALAAVLTRRGEEAAQARQDPVAARWVLRALAATLVLYAIQAAYSKDVSNAIETTGFFLVPFTVLAVLLLQIRWTKRLQGLVLASVTVVALLYGGYALWQYAGRDLILNEELTDSNELHLYFRVNSVFKDPNVLGRSLALVIVALAAWVTWANRGRAPWLATGGALLLTGALAVTFSITSLAAVLTGLVAVAWLRFGLRFGLAAAAVCAAVAVSLATVGPTDDELGSSGIDEATSGRAGLVEGGAELAEKRPFGGWGSGSFGAAFVTQIEPTQTTTSHAEPITVAAEQGIVGLGAYLLVIGASLLLLLGGRAGESIGRTAVAGCYVALLAHSIGYAAFAIDPATWALLALGLGLARDEELPALSRA